MITIKDTLVDLIGDADWDPKAYAEIWSADELRDAGGNTVTDKRLQIPITAEGLETLPLSPGAAFIRLHLGTLRPSLGPYAITIPDTTGERRIVELRTELPPNADPPTTIDATRVNGLPAAIEEVGNGIYAPVDAATPAANSFVVIGPSLEEQNGQGATVIDPTFASALTSSLRARGWFHWCNAYLNNQLTLVRNAGVGGERYDQMRARFLTDVIAYPSDWVVIGSATNDIGAGRTAAQTIADLDWMISQCITDSRRVLVHNIPPRSTHTTTAQRLVLFEVNRYIAGLSATKRGVIPVDIWAPFADPANGAPVAGTTIDGTHYSAEGAALVGRATATALAGQIVNQPPVTSSLIDPRRFLPNPSFLGNGYGWSALTNSSATYSQESGGYANKAVISISGNSSLTTPRGIACTEYISGGRFAIGNKVQVTVRLKWSNLVPLSGATPCTPVVQLEQYNASGTTTRTAHTLYTTSGEWTTDHSKMPTSGEGVFTTWVSTIDATCDRVRLILGWKGAASVTIEASGLAPLKDAAATAASPTPAFAIPGSTDPGVAGFSKRWVTDSLAGADGTSVSSWTDVAGATSLAQASAGLQPTIQTVNGIKVLRFDGVDDYLNVTGLPEYSSIVFIGRMAADADTAVAHGLFQGGSGGTDAIGVTRGTTAAQLRTNVFWTESRSASVAALTAANGVGKVLVMRNTSGDARFENNGVETVNATAVTDTGVTTLDLGRRTTTYGRIEVVEVILYTAGLTDSEMDAVYAAAQANYPALFA